MGCLQDLIPDVWQLVFSQITVEGCVIDADEHGLHDGPGDAMCLSAQNGKAVHIDGVSCGQAMLVYWGSGL